jgi:hypothetical protein
VDAFTLFFRMLYLVRMRKEGVEPNVEPLVARWRLLYTSCIHGVPYTRNDIW